MPRRNSRQTTDPARSCVRRATKRVAGAVYCGSRLWLGTLRMVGPKKCTAASHPLRPWALLRVVWRHHRWRFRSCYSVRPRSSAAIVRFWPVYAGLGSRFAISDQRSSLGGLDHAHVLRDKSGYSASGLAGAFAERGFVALLASISEGVRSGPVGCGDTRQSNIRRIGARRRKWCVGYLRTTEGMGHGCGAVLALRGLLRALRMRWRSCGSGSSPRGANAPSSSTWTSAETTRPTRAIVEEGLPDLLETMDRGSAYYVVLYGEGHPSEILFVGYSFD
jgi:hypothetical protein